ncbi:MAG: class I SAM-dependent rRNA methyltransferase [Chloroflexi bacterium]|jgi:23S rRNA (cytosine1962-C5)-methyltransferase|nr:class I SAM-dependent rRNA methyltransferase [Chloroflexota bacterium]
MKKHKADKRPIVVASAAIRKTLQQGHPWVYRNQLEPVRGQMPRLRNGTWVTVVSGGYEGIGLWDEDSAIAVRVFATREQPDDRWIAQRVREAWELRAPLRTEQTTAYRWVYGESDGLPGIVVDWYDGFAAISLYASSVATLVEPVLAALRDIAPLRGAVLRRTSDDESDTKTRVVEHLWGQRPDALTVLENGLRFHVNLLEGQKTGLFLDHRDNRRYLEQWCRDKRVLDCFAYTGAFALYAARGGAREITTVDIAPASPTEVERNLQLNGFDPAPHHLVAQDSFAWLEQCVREKTRYDLIILDPPSMARDKSSRYAAARAYIRLNRLALQCLEPGGLLATASCTSQVSPAMFREALGEAAAQARVRLAILHEAGHALDHPVAAHFPESRYLKFILARMRPAL